jgi:hypothetical protein
VKSCPFCNGLDIKDVKAEETDAGIVFYLDNPQVSMNLEAFKTLCKIHQEEWIVYFPPHPPIPTDLFQEA